jgi:hypothetical protein
MCSSDVSGIDQESSLFLTQWHPGYRKSFASFACLRAEARKTLWTIDNEGPTLLCALQRIKIHRVLSGINDGRLKVSTFSNFHLGRRSSEAPSSLSPFQNDAESWNSRQTSVMPRW